MTPSSRTATRIPAARHRSPGRATVPAGPLALVGAVLASAVAVALTLTGHRGPAVAVASVGLALAVAGLLLGRVRRGSGPRGS
ncbi:hypothetical protein [Kineococcus sp. NPDC059986]|uniref:hypothetical protein n=1 Tax=Kineococcus sp. NPDC059986 TaxID=3155538 RepID=UPI00344C9C49